MLQLLLVYSSDILGLECGGDHYVHNLTLHGYVKCINNIKYTFYVGIFSRL